MANVWKVGSRWSSNGGKESSIIDVFRRNNVVFVGTETERFKREVKSGDFFAITDGLRVISVAKALEDSTEITKIDIIESDRDSDRFDYEDWVIGARVHIVDLPDKDCWSYCMGTFHNVNDDEYRKKIQTLYETLGHPDNCTSDCPEQNEETSKNQYYMVINQNNVKLYSKTLREVFRIPPASTAGYDPLEHKLNIPDYQRAYEWKTDHVTNLLKDTYDAFKKNKPYLMGTLILHKHTIDEPTTSEESNTISEESKIILDIVDGQQRLITLTILLTILDPNIKDLSLLNANFDNNKSFYYIRNTKTTIETFLDDKQTSELPQYKDYLLNKIRFAVLIVSGDNALDLAYTFFDSVNSKGKGLSDFDLLKAHHLMFIPLEQETLAGKHNDYWQSKDAKHNEVFSQVLRRIRMWSRGNERDSKADRNDYYEFVSAIEPNELEQNEHLFNRYMQPDAYRSWSRNGDNVVLNQKVHNVNMEDLLPMEIPQTIEGGDAFFLYAKRYHSEYEKLFAPKDHTNSTALNFVSELAKSMDNDKLRMAFKAATLLYYDKFGESRLIEAATCVELIISAKRFEWGSSRPSPVRIEGVLSFVKEENIIPIILNSTVVSHVISQLNAKISSQKRETKGSPTLFYYLDRIQKFYTKNQGKIRNERLIEKIKLVYL